MLRRIAAGALACVMIVLGCYRSPNTPVWLDIAASGLLFFYAWQLLLYAFREEN